MLKECTSSAPAEGPGLDANGYSVAICNRKTALSAHCGEWLLSNHSLPLFAGAAAPAKFGYGGFEYCSQRRWYIEGVPEMHLQVPARRHLPRGPSHTLTRRHGGSSVPNRDGAPKADGVGRWGGMQTGIIPGVGYAINQGSWRSTPTALFYAPMPYEVVIDGKQNNFLNRTVELPMAPTLLQIHADNISVDGIVFTFTAGVQGCGGAADSEGAERAGPKPGACDADLAEMAAGAIVISGGSAGVRITNITTRGEFGWRREAP